METLQIDLAGTWRLSGRLEHGTEETGLLQARVPGNIEQSLQQAGLVADPYVEMNARQLRKFEFYGWVFAREFDYDGAPRQMELVCEGLDCFATLRLNGQEIGRSENALITHRFPVGGALKSGKNRLEILIASANNVFRKHPVDAMSFGAFPFNYESLRIRKPAHVWGWDIMPRMALGGIFRPIYLQELPEHRFLETFLQLSQLHPDRAALTFHYHYATSLAVLEDLSVEVSGECGDSLFRKKLPAWSTAGVLKFDLPKPRLWWPRGYGAPDLYRVRAVLRQGERELARREFRAGIRKIELRAEEVWTDDDRPNFQFVVNDLPVNIRGSNHVPADALHAADPARIPEIVRLACDLNCNMLRVWGGGIYESPLFYDLCDEHGLMLWHDFMMGCAIYPQDGAFLRTIRHEAVEAVTRLRQHPCIALWAGDNECDCLPFWAHPFEPNRNRITREVLPRLLLRLDPTRAYLPSSPWYAPRAVKKAAELGGRFDPMFLAPEQHLWGPRDYFKSDFYRNTRASFVSEIGYHGCPNVGSIRKFIAEERLWPYADNEQWDYHASNPFYGDDNYLNYRTQLMADQIKELFGRIPDNLDDFALASQICQAEANKYFVELVRSRKKMTGIIWWNLSDGWPQFSDAVVDYYFGKKLAYHYLKRVQRDLLVMVGEATAWQQAVIVSNDGAVAKNGNYKVWDAGSGQVLSEKSFNAGANAKLELDRFKVCTTEQRLLLISWRLDSGETGFNHFLCGQPQYDLDRYRREWLPAIAGLDHSFVPAEVSK